jgi:hypothetical protein
MPLPPMNRVNPRTNTMAGSCAFSVETGFSPSSWSRRPVLHGSHELPNSLFDVPRIDLLDRGAFEAILARRREGGKRLFALNADGRLDTTSLDMDSPPPLSDNPEYRALENTSDRQCARDQQSYSHQRDRPRIRHTGDGRPSHLFLRVDVLERACASGLSVADAGGLSRIWPPCDGGSFLACFLRNSFNACLCECAGRDSRAWWR